MRIRNNYKTFRYIKEGTIIAINNLDTGVIKNAYFIEFTMDSNRLIFRYRYSGNDNITRLFFNKKDINPDFIDRRTVKGKSFIITINDC